MDKLFDDAGDEVKYDFEIQRGRYYVDGILCENDDEETKVVTYKNQPNYPSPESLKDNFYLVYLDVWERHITYIQDDSIREVALGGPDTATRAEVVWQVKVEADEIDGSTTCDTPEDWKTRVEKRWQPRNRGQLSAKAEIIEDPTDPCITSPEARYRGAENQLYRVEIHQGGSKNEATFKWSRENGAIVFPIRAVNGKTITLESAVLDGRFSLRKDDWVEIVDDDYVLQGRADPLLQVASVDRAKMEVTLKQAPAASVGWDLTKNLLLRRWDHRASASIEDKPQMTDAGDLLVQEDEWLNLEQGIQIRFQGTETHKYRTGDYWLIPARTATGKVEWPKNANGTPKAMRPHGVEHHYAPLAIIQVKGGSVSVEHDCRYYIEQIAEPV
jgi:hypothetical protein